MTLMNEKVKLSNGFLMPKIAFGTYNLNKDHVEAIISNALEAGYRHFETAPIYLNEAAIGRAFKQSAIPRDDLFITSKVPPHVKSYNGTLRVVERIMNKLNVDYLDALLINNPVPWGEEGKDYVKENREVWRAMEHMYDKEVIGAIGVSNFTVEDLKSLISTAKIKPHINQLGIFAGHTLKSIRSFCENQGIIIQGHSPLARGRLIKEDWFINLAEKENLSPAQLALRYVFELGVNPVVKSNSLKHMKDNIQIDCLISKATIERLNATEKDVRDYRPPNAKMQL